MAEPGDSDLPVEVYRDEPEDSLARLLALRAVLDVCIEEVRAGTCSEHEALETIALTAVSHAAYVNVPLTQIVDSWLCGLDHRRERERDEGVGACDDDRL